MDRVTAAMTALADRLEQDPTEAKNAMHRRVTEDVPEYFSADPAVTAAGYESLGPVAQEFAAALRPTATPLPEGIQGRMLEEIVFAARTGIAWDPLEDALRAGLAGLWEWMMATVPSLGVDRSTQLAVIDSGTRTLFRWFDHTIRHARATYLAERARLGQSASRRRAELVRDLVAGRPVREEQLGYPLMRSHLALVIWRPGGIVDRAAVPRSTDIAAVMSADGDLGSMWVFAATTTANHRVEDIIDMLGLDAGIRIAAGSFHHGAHGLVRSHHEALATYSLALQKLDGRPRRLTTYREIDLDTLIMRDPTAASRMARAELGELGAKTGRAERIRDTVAVYVNNACSTSLAARVLGISERTIRNRLLTAEQLLGASIQERTVQLGAALRIHETIAWRDLRADELVLPAPHRAGDS
ncbi:PucR family transcriptional regulator [Nocardia sp. NPDC003183]